MCRCVGVYVCIMGRCVVGVGVYVCSRGSVCRCVVGVGV